jgi:hypothetical protein
MVSAYWRRIHRCAVREARYALGMETGERALIIIVVSILSVALIWLTDGHEMATGAFITKAAVTGAIILVFPFVYCWKFITAPPKIDAEANEKIIQFEQTRAQLSVSDPYFVYDASGGIWKIKIRNDGASAAHVQMTLCNITPRPKSPFWSHDFPYRILQDGSTLDSNECHIHRGSDAIFEVTRIWPASGIGFLTSLNTRIPGNQVLIETDERLEMKYEITAENSDVLGFILRMHANTEGIVFERIA